MKVVKYLTINFAVFITLLVIIDPFFSAPRLKTSRVVNLREPAPNEDFTIAFSEYLANRSQGLNTGSEFRLRTNNQGFYIGENTSLSTDSIDMIFYGGSTTECIYVDEAKRFPYLVGESLINIATNKKVVTLNGGLRGNNSLHSLINLIAKGLPLKPKIVVLMHNVNDLSQLEKTGSYWNAPSTRKIIIDSNPSNFSDRFYQFTKSVKDLLIPNLYGKVSMQFRAYKKNQSDYSDEWRNFRRRSDYDMDQLLIDFEQSVRSFIHVARLHEIEVVLMTQFNRLNPEDDFSRSQYTSDFDQLCRNYKRFNDKIREVSIREHVPLIDLAEKVPGNSTYIYDWIHLNTAGSELVTDVIVEELSNIYSDYAPVRDNENL